MVLLRFFFRACNRVASVGRPELSQWLLSGWVVACKTPRAASSRLFITIQTVPAPTSARSRCRTARLMPRLSGGEQAILRPAHLLWSGIIGGREVLSGRP